MTHLLGGQRRNRGRGGGERLDLVVCPQAGDERGLVTFAVHYFRMRSLGKSRWTYWDRPRRFSSFLRSYSGSFSHALVSSTVETNPRERSVVAGRSWARRAVHNILGEKGRGTRRQCCKPAGNTRRARELRGASASAGQARSIAEIPRRAACAAFALHCARRRRQRRAGHRGCPRRTAPAQSAI